jgi:hypothetical protein
MNSAENFQICDIFSTVDNNGEDSAAALAKKVMMREFIADGATGPKKLTLALLENSFTRATRLAVHRMPIITSPIWGVVCARVGDRLRQRQVIRANLVQEPRFGRP